MLLLVLSAEICSVSLGVFVFLFPFLFLGASRFSWCSRSSRSQGSQGKKHGLPSPYWWCFKTLSVLRHSAGFVFVMNLTTLLVLPIIAEPLPLERERGPCRKSVLFPIKLTSVVFFSNFFSLLSYVLGIWMELAWALPSFRRPKADSSFTPLASLSLGWGTWGVDVFARWSDYKVASFLARTLLQGEINRFPIAQSLLLVVLGFIFF